MTTSIFAASSGLAFDSKCKLSCRLSMFSVVLPGRLPLANPQQVDETHCVFPLEDAANIQHVVVFMTGVQPFPPGYSATVHLLWPTPSSTSASSSAPAFSSAAANPKPKWMLLGCLRNTKPSAIFKVRPPTLPAVVNNPGWGGAAGGFGAPPQTQTQPITATLGISIEPDPLVDSQIATLPAANTTTGANGANAATASTSSANAADGTALELAPKIAKNAFSYLSSFAPDSAPQTVPLLQRWLEQLERKLRAQGPAFLDKQE